jgi:hypothetical protein
MLHTFCLAWQKLGSFADMESLPSPETLGPILDSARHLWPLRTPGQYPRLRGKGSRLGGVRS